jgi:hypothetical protein
MIRHADTNSRPRWLPVSLTGGRRNGFDETTSKDGGLKYTSPNWPALSGSRLSSSHSPRRPSPQSTSTTGAVSPATQNRAKTSAMRALFRHARCKTRGWIPAYAPSCAARTATPATMTTCTPAARCTGDVYGRRALREPRLMDSVHVLLRELQHRQRGWGRLPHGHALRIEGGKAKSIGGKRTR